MGRVLVTGATGYLGAHACLALADAGRDLVAVDNFCNSSPRVLQTIEELSGGRVDFHNADVRDSAALDRVFGDGDIDVVLHFAGLKSVAESIDDPLRYFHINAGGTMAMLDAMHRHHVAKLIFSSSCTVYGEGFIDQTPIDEGAPLQPVSPYGLSKLMAEQVVNEYAGANDEFQAFVLRYFNPIGGEPTGRLGDDPAYSRTSLLPIVFEVLTGSRDRLVVHGDDYPTVDGTCLRDYVHVVDLIDAHRMAVDLIDTAQGVEAINLGTGVGRSVLDVVTAVERTTGHRVPIEIGGRRRGDAAAAIADPAKALARLGWKSEFDLDRMCEDTWRWRLNNPIGYRPMGHQGQD